MTDIPIAGVVAPPRPPATHIASVCYVRAGSLRVEGLVGSLCGEVIDAGARLLNRKALRELTFQSKYDLNLCPRCEAIAS